MKLILNNCAQIVDHPAAVCIYFLDFFMIIHNYFVKHYHTSSADRDSVSFS